LKPLLCANRQVLLRSRPTGIAQAENFELVSGLIPELQDGQILVRNHYLSVEPAMRGWIADIGNYLAPVAIGEVMRSIAAGLVVESKDAHYAVGDAVTGWFGWQEFAVVTADRIIRKVTDNDLPLSLSLGILGINGLTAHLALTKIGLPMPNETVVVTTAAGAVGSAAGQIAKLMGCRTIGITRGAQKVDLCRDLFGFDVALDYTAPDWREKLLLACPDGIDIYFDNVAGPISDAVHGHLAQNSRVIICGTASIEDWSHWPQGPRIERHLLVKRARMQGFVIFDHQDDYPASITQLATWVRTGALRYQEDILMGMECCPDAIAGLYRGENFGKRVIRLV
jgi:NADPH-dependent curcumin reductase CurA